MPFKIVRNDITKMQVDAVVNTANRKPLYSSGVDTAIYKAAGEEELLEARREIGFMNHGDVAITPGFKLPAKYIIHAVSPRYIDGESGEEAKLRSCYRKSLTLAYEHKCESIAFPLISTGCFGYPKEEAMRIAVDEIHAFLLKHNMLIYLVVFDTASTWLGLNLYPDLEAYIDHNYVREKRVEEYGDPNFGTASVSTRKNVPYQELRRQVANRSKMATAQTMRVDECAQECSTPLVLDCGKMDEEEYHKFLKNKDTTLKERMKHISDTFQEYLMYLIEEKGLTNADVYKRAIITKQLFSKIKLNPNYHPDKSTAMRLCIGATLNLDETKDLLSRAGYALSPCDKRDIIFSFFIENRIYDMIELDIVLSEHDLECFIE